MRQRSDLIFRPAMLVLLVWLIPASFVEAGHRNHRAKPAPIILSTDVAAGLIDTHGGKSLSPVTFSAAYDWGNDTSAAPQDIDDGLALAMSLNLDAARQVRLLAVIPTYGNASLPAEMMVARQITYDLKGRADISIWPGASSPLSQILHAEPLWFDGTPVQVDGRFGSFQAACINPGVQLMAKMIRSSEVPVTLLALGPMTDIACLLNTERKPVLKNIKEIIAIASQLEGESLQVNGLVVNDFNFRMDPVGGTLLLAALQRADVPIRLMSFSLTGQTSQAGDLIPFNEVAYPGPTYPNPRSVRSFNWLLAAAEPRNEYWASIFGTEEGPFDQYAVIAAIRPELFECVAARAYVQQCPTPAWSPDYPVDDDGNPTEQPYNADNNPCVDHGSANGGSLSEVPAQLIVSQDPNDSGPLVRGITGIDGNIPSIDSEAVPVIACLDFAGAAERAEFEDLLKMYTW